MRKILTGRRRTAVIAVTAFSVLGGTALAAAAVEGAASKKAPIATITSKSGKCKSGYEKVTLHSGKGKKKQTVYVCVEKHTKTITKTKTVKSPYQAANSDLIASGSNTAYSVLASLDAEFNGIEGCDPIASGSTVQPLDFSCPSGSLTDFTGTPASENPINDVVTEEPAIGGSSGVSQLQYQGKHLATYTGGKVAPINFASTTSGPSSTNDQGLNYVAYAEDGLSWFHYTSVDGTPSDSAQFTDLSKTDLQDIYDGSYTNWNQITDEPGETGSGTIDVYTASAGAGVRSVWEKYLGEASGGSSVPIESRGSAYANSHIIPQNETQDIVANGDESSAIFFFSVGKFNTICGDGTNAACTDGTVGTTAALGDIDGVAPTAQNIYGTSGTQFEPTLYLYNVYSNGTNPNIPVATPATLNFASEDGFLCKPGTGITDPATGETVRQEIDTTILKAGFLPLDQSTLGTGGVADESGAISPFAEDTGVTNPAVVPSTSPYAKYDLSGSNPQGYCKTSTTDTVSITQ